MADYWKSNPKKFCEFCKCWFLDNKASRDFHERGKRHKENVKLKISELKRKGSEDARKQKETSQYLIDIEKAALAQFREDMRKDPSLASKYGINLNNKQISFDAKKSDLNSPNQGLSNAIINNTDTADSSEIDGMTVVDEAWQEAVTEEGHVYYWNSITNESVWQLPENINSNSETIGKQEENSKPHKLKIETEIFDSKYIKNNVETSTDEFKIEFENKIEIKSELKDSFSETIKLNNRENCINSPDGNNIFELPVDTLGHATYTYTPDIHYEEESGEGQFNFGEKVASFKNTKATSVAFKKRKIHRNNIKTVNDIE